MIDYSIKGKNHRLCEDKIVHAKFHCHLCNTELNNEAWMGGYKLVCKGCADILKKHGYFLKKIEMKDGVPIWRLIQEEPLCH